MIAVSSVRSAAGCGGSHSRLANGVSTVPSAIGEATTASIRSATSSPAVDAAERKSERLFATFACRAAIDASNRRARRPVASGRSTAALTLSAAAVPALCAVSVNATRSPGRTSCAGSATKVSTIVARSPAPTTNR